jgi:hypothetical protein
MTGPTGPTILEDLAAAIAGVCTTHGITVDDDGLIGAAHAARRALGPVGHGGGTTAALPREGVDRCHCGAKYWAGDRCHSCGEHWRP